MKPALLAPLLAGLIGLGLAWGTDRLLRERTTVTRLSPDETSRASLVERDRQSTARTFEIRIEDLVKSATTSIFRSPEEGKPYGTERVIWSKDGAWLLLVGRHFFVKNDLFLDNGDQLYFLYHLPTRRTWCNAEASSLPPLKAGTIEGIEFTEPVKLKDKSS